jgi:branched-chain amino acid aminotransferase
MGEEMTPLVYVNGRWLPEERALVPANDHGFLYGDGIYETLRVYGGRVFLIDAHLRRLEASAKGIGLRLPLKRAAFAGLLAESVARQRLDEAVIRLTVTRGAGPYGFDPRLCPTPTVVVAARAFHGYPPAFHAKGLNLAVVSVPRNNAAALPPSVKSTSCLNGILAKMEAIRMKADEGLFLTDRGHLAEGTVSNIFLVHRGRLLTPRLDGDLLPGTTRSLVLRLAGAFRLPVHETLLRPEQLRTADEIFLTNTTMEVMPVGRVLFADRSPARRLPVGPVTKRLRDGFQAYVEAWKKRAK